MTEVKTIKDVDEQAWAEFKSLAAKNNVKMGVFFKTMLNEYKKSTNTFWERILNGEKILSDKEADEMEKVVVAVRKEHGFRV
ncbi:hypothetical protein COV18_04735 [Candidatus Woesearchaeota archaeon CG10_big_fil_rev_8_21_14_0_10_37_12]|nr:MAG: hypothetical protein COV18_04735 [Candidatus Woesearchaeota archaeon CG10_big_fil_rev_8_21_14_0_10_37_12]